MFSALYYLFTLVHTTILCILSALALLFTYPFQKNRRIVHELSRYMTWLFFLIPGIRRPVKGMENIDKTKSYVIVMNHNSGLDILAAYKIPLNFRWVSKKEVFKTPFFGPMLLVHGDIPIERGNASAAMAKVIRDGKLWINRGVSIAIFPEGTRSKSGDINRFKAGAFTLAKEAGVEILPVVMNGTRDSLKGWKMNWGHTIGFRVLKPISVEEIQNTETKDLMDKVHGQMTEALAQMREEMKDLK